MSIHHTTCDGLGASRVLTEMAEIYSAGVENRAPKLEPVNPFTRTLEALPAWLDSEVRPRGESLWRGLYPDPIEALNLDRLRVRRPVLVSETSSPLDGARAHLDVKASVLTALKKKAQASNTTVFMNLFATWGILIGKLTGARSLGIPVPLAARGFKGTMDQVANWVNLVPLPVRVAPGMRYSEVLAGVKKAMMVAYAAMDYPAGDLTRWLRETGRLPEGAFPCVTFNLEPAPKSPTFANAEGSLLGSPVVASEFPLTVNLTEIAGLLLIDADYQVCEFLKEDVLGLLERYRTLLERVAREDGDLDVEAMLNAAGDGKDVRGDGDEKKQRWKKRIAGLS